MQLNQKEIGELVNLVSKERDDFSQVTKRYRPTLAEVARQELLWGISTKLSREYTEIADKALKT